MSLQKLSGKVFGRFRPHRGNTDNTDFSFLNSLSFTCLFNFRMGLGKETFGSVKNLVRGETGGANSMGKIGSFLPSFSNEF